MEEVKKRQISKRDYQQGPSDAAMKKAWCQFCYVKFGHRIIAVSLFCYNMHNVTQITFNSINRWNKGVVSWFLIVFGVSDIF